MMTLLSGFKALAVATVGLVLSTLTAASPLDDRHTPSTCSGTPYTTVYVTSSLITTYTTVTIPTTNYIPHSCFTYFVATAQSNNAFCGTTTSCPPHIMCIVRSTFTAPCKDPCCPHTPTITSLGGCSTCQTGCATEWVTVTRSTDCQATNTPTAK